MEFAKKNRDLIVKMYVEDGKSSYEIAKELNTYASKILRSLEYLGIDRRSYSDAQSNALENGRSLHPTSGKKLTEETKMKIGKSRSRSWSNMSDEERQAISKMNKDKWDKMTEAEKESLRQKAFEAIRYSSKHGSKTERYLRNKLENDGYNVVFHSRNVTSRTDLELDLFIPELKTAIEIDGPSHFLPIWGEEKLTKQQSADTIKQGILIDHGYVVIRVKQIDKKLSITKMNDIYEMIVKELKDIDNNFPKKEKRLIEIEVKDGRTERL